MKRIYLDYASLAPIDRRVLREMGRYSSAEYVNPSSLYKEGVAAKKALEDSRQMIAGFLHAHADEIVFTGGGTEANALALGGVLKAARQNGMPRPHLIVSNIEHSSIRESAVIAERAGCEVTRLAVDPRGLISPEKLKEAIKPNTALISIMTVNNEIGTVQPIREIVKVVRHYRKGIGDRVEGIESTKNSKTASTKPYTLCPTTYPLFHTDAAQAALYEDLNVERFGVDLLTLDSSKACGPRGMGALFVRRGTPIDPIMYGGGQERGLRSGTENLPAIRGFAKALTIAAAERDREAERVLRLKEHFLKGLTKIRPDIEANPAPIEMPAGRGRPSASLLKSDEKSASPHILNVSIPGIDNELFVLRLDAAGVACSTRSSCLRDADQSYVLKAIGADSRTAVRFSFGRQTGKAGLDRALAAIAKALKL